MEEIEMENLRGELIRKVIRESEEVDVSDWIYEEVCAFFNNISDEEKYDYDLKCEGGKTYIIYAQSIVV